jgi:Delta7-sterol 5-desaturase
MLHTLHNFSPFEAATFFLLANAGIFVISVTLCFWLGCKFKGKRIFARWEPIRTLELSAALASIGLNAGISVIGWLLWKAEYITIHSGSLLEAFFHFICMVIFMDFGMYVFHRLAHIPLAFALMHSFHHRHETTNPISLFVLHPVEVLGFGALMITYLLFVPIEIAGLIMYLTMNILWGTLGHSGVEPFPAKLSALPLLRIVGTSTFHAEHHEHPKYNFGFYTLIWDKLFGTLDPDYEKRFRQNG